MEGPLRLPGVLRVGLWVGLAWGTVIALLDGLPLLLDGSLGSYPGSRLLALALLVAVEGLLACLAGGLVAAVIWAASLLLRRPAWRSPRPVGAVTAGILTAVGAAVFGLHRFQPGLPGRLFLLALAAALGAGLASLLIRVRPARALRTLRVAVLALYLVAVAVVGLTAGVRAWQARTEGAGEPGAGDAERPNVVLITAGGLRPDHLGAYGYEVNTSPNLDALARRGTRFAQAFAPASWSEPSLASLLTSLYPTELGIDCRATLICRPHLDEARTTLAEALGAAGYRTQAFLTGSWLTEELGFAQGFDGFDSVRPEEPFDWEPMRSRLVGRLLGCGRDSAACQWLSWVHAALFDSPLPAGWGGDVANGRAERFLRLHGGGPFFLWVHYAEALPPYDLEEPLPPLPEGTLAGPLRRLTKLGYWELGDPFTPREELLPGDQVGLTALYDAEVRRVDRLVGDLLALVERQGLLDRTVVVVTSDHGQEFMDHGGYTYGHSLYDEVLRVPLLVAGAPAQAWAGGLVETPVSLVDLLPTLLDLGAAAVPLEAQGRSLLPALRGEALEAGPIYAESTYRVPYELKSVRRDGLKLIYGRGPVELFDLAADPGEQHDLSAVMPEAAELLRRDLLDWMAHATQVAADLPRARPPTQVRDVAW